MPKQKENRIENPANAINQHFIRRNEVLVNGKFDIQFTTSKIRRYITDAASISAAAETLGEQADKV